MPGTSRDWTTDAASIVIEKNNNVNPNNVPPCSSVLSHESCKDSVMLLFSSIIKGENNESLPAI